MKSMKLSTEYKNVKIEAETSIPESSSYIDNHVFEIIYALERLSKSIGYTVVLEDFDRLGTEICVDIFSKMRRINYLVNDRKIVKHRIRFIYAFDDSVFRLTRNTKFFDYILSVTPQLNSVNAGEVLKNNLIENAQASSDEIVVETLKEYNKEFWNKVGMIVNDYRSLHHIQNDFYLFLKIIDNGYIIE